MTFEHIYIHVYSKFVTSGSYPNIKHLGQGKKTYPDVVAKTIYNIYVCLTSVINHPDALRFSIFVYLIYE